MKRKSQAALEFLTTYAWAFLVILIMVGALAYFGVLRPSKLLPDRCNFGSEIDCSDFRITYGTGSNGAVNLRLKNSVGEAIKIDDIHEDPAKLNGIVLAREGGTYSCKLDTITDETIPNGAEAPVTITWNSDEVKEVSFKDCPASTTGFVAGDKAKVFVTINYYSAKSGSTYKHEVSGEVFTTVT